MFSVGLLEVVLGDIQTYPNSKRESWGHHAKFKIQDFKANPLAHSWTLRCLSFLYWDLLKIPRRNEPQSPQKKTLRRQTNIFSLSSSTCSPSDGGWFSPQQKLQYLSSKTLFSKSSTYQGPPKRIKTSSFWHQTTRVSCDPPKKNMLVFRFLLNLNFLFPLFSCIFLDLTHHCFFSFAIFKSPNPSNRGAA